MKPLPHRRLIAATLALLPAYALIREARADDTVLDRRLGAARWIARQDELARALRSGDLSPRGWHDAVNQLAGEVDVAQLLAEAGRDPGQTHPAFMRDPVKRSVHFIEADGRPRRLIYSAATFTFGPDNVITPHAHRHMASAHMVVEGRVRIRTFDRVADRDDALVVRATGDRVGGVGEAAAMTSARDNIHWFAPASARAVTFDVIVDGLDAGEPDYLIQPIDPLGGVHQADGTIVAPLLSFEESMRRYTARM
jgi:hypothetical protein